MIIKVAVYYELDEKLKPEEVDTLTSLLQNQVTQHLSDTGGDKLKINLNYVKVIVKLLTWIQVKNRVTSKLK